MTMKLKKFKVRFCIAPERDDQIVEVICTDETAAKCIVKQLVEKSSVFPRHVDIHAIDEIAS